MQPQSANQSRAVGRISTNIEIKGCFSDDIGLVISHELGNPRIDGDVKAIDQPVDVHRIGGEVKRFSEFLFAESQDVLCGKVFTRISVEVDL